MDYNVVEEKLRVLHEQFTLKFDELKHENENLARRLNRIEENLNVKEGPTPNKVEKKGNPSIELNREKQRNTKKQSSKENDTSKCQPQKKKQTEKTLLVNDEQGKEQPETEEIVEENVTEDNQEQDDIEFAQNIDMSKYLSDQNVEAVDEENSLARHEDDGHRHVIEQRMLPTKVITGFCFRPITGWKNKTGGFEISQELISFNPRNIKVGLYGRDSGEEIANLTIDLGVVEKAEASVQDKTVIHLYGSDLYLASQQTLLFTNLSSYTIIDENSKDKIRISIENFSVEDSGYLAEYFRRNGIYFKMNEEPVVGEVFFKKLQRGKKLSSDQSEMTVGDTECLIDSFKTFQYLDKILFSCNICGHLSTVKSKLESHVYFSHVLPKRRMSEADIVKDYLED